MRPTRKLTDIPGYPVVAGTELLAIGISIAWWAKVDVSPLFLDGCAWKSDGGIRPPF